MKMENKTLSLPGLKMMQLYILKKKGRTFKNLLHGDSCHHSKYLEFKEKRESTSLMSSFSMGKNLLKNKLGNL